MCMYTTYARALKHYVFMLCVTIARVPRPLSKLKPGATPGSYDAVGNIECVHITSYMKKYIYTCTVYLCTQAKIICVYEHVHVCTDNHHVCVVGIV